MEHQERNDDAAILAEALDPVRLASFCKALPKAELHQHMSGSFRRVRVLCVSFTHSSHTHTSRHAQAHTITSASHARASSMHTPARQPHTPRGLSASACPAACERLCVISVLYVPPRGVTPPAGVKISGRSKLPMRPQSKTKFATEAPSLCY